MKKSEMVSRIKGVEETASLLQTDIFLLELKLQDTQAAINKLENTLEALQEDVPKTLLQRLFPRRSSE